MLNDTLKLAAVAATEVQDREITLLAVLKKSDATRKEKSDACRELARIASKEAVPKLAALLGDPELSHMARYALETIPDSSVDEVLCDALDHLKFTITSDNLKVGSGNVENALRDLTLQTRSKLLAGVIGSIGVRRIAKAVEPLAKRLKDTDMEIAQAAARALGSIGTVAAAEAISGALSGASEANLLALCEGLFRCAEALSKQGIKDKALAIYDQLRSLKAPHQIRTGALRGAVLLQGEKGIPLLLEALRSDDFSQAAAAARIAFEMDNAHVNKALADVKSSLSADKQELLKRSIGI